MPPFKPTTLPYFLYDNLRVCDLFENVHWNKQLIEFIFNMVDRELIQSIPLSPHGGFDKMIWHHTLRGIFTVSSAYQVGFLK